MIVGSSLSFWFGILGRGTSTFDGNALAYAVLNKLLLMNCRILFSTHYHTLVEEFEQHPSVKLGYMVIYEREQTMNSIIHFLVLLEFV